MGLRIVDLRPCERCGLGLVREGPLFYKVIIETHAADLQRIRGGAKPGDVVTDVMGTKEGLVCMGCFVSGEAREKKEREEDNG